MLARNLTTFDPERRSDWDGLEVRRVCVGLQKDLAIGGRGERNTMSELLKELVCALTSNVKLQDELLHECVVRLWRLEFENPGRSEEWYLQNCRSEIKHLFGAGATIVEAQKRQSRRLA